jgi:hypothetical protein
MSRWWLTSTGVIAALAIAFAVGYGFGHGWGAPQWGPFAEWFAGVLTLFAVVVALRESLRGQRSRLVDHELSRRRENLAAQSDLWAAIAKMTISTVAFRVYFENLPPTFDPNVPRTDNDPDATGMPLAFEMGAKYESFVAKWADTIEPRLFTALALLHGTPLDEPLRELNVKLAEVIRTQVPLLAEQFKEGRRPDTSSMRAAWNDVAGRRQEHLDLARQHFGLALADVHRILE